MVGCVICGALFYFVLQAYVFEMDEEYAESDIPTVLIRSKADCPVQEVRK